MLNLEIWVGDFPLGTNIFLTSCGKGNDDLRKMDTFDVVMSVFFVILIAFIVGVFIYFIVRHFKNK